MARAVEGKGTAEEWRLVMVPCYKCRFSHKTDISKWPISCHRHSPTMPLEDVADWPVVGPEDAVIGCGDGEAEPDAAD